MKLTLNRWPASGTSFEFTTFTFTVPTPRPATWLAAPVDAGVYPATLGLGRAATTLMGRIRPPRVVRETVIAFSDG